MPPHSSGAGRGSRKQRVNRRRWLLETWGDGVTVMCAIDWDDDCAGLLTEETLTVDRYPVAGVDGGTYRRSNIRPACQSCNERSGAFAVWERLVERRAKRE